MDEPCAWSGVARGSLPSLPSLRRVAAAPAVKLVAADPAGVAPAAAQAPVAADTPRTSPTFAAFGVSDKLEVVWPGDIAFGVTLTESPLGAPVLVPSLFGLSISVQSPPDSRYNTTAVLDAYCAPESYLHSSALRPALGRAVGGQLTPAPVSFQPLALYDTVFEMSIEEVTLGRIVWVFLSDVPGIASLLDVLDSASLGLGRVALNPGISTVVPNNGDAPIAPGLLVNISQLDLFNFFEVPVAVRRRGKRTRRARAQGPATLSLCSCSLGFAGAAHDTAAADAVPAHRG